MTFFTKKPWRQVEANPIVATVGEVSLTVSHINGRIEISIDAPESMKINVQEPTSRARTPLRDDRARRRNLE